MKRFRPLQSILLLFLFSPVPLAFAANADTARAKGAGVYQPLIVIDGLRPDYVTPDRMPNLFEWSRGGSVEALLGGPLGLEGDSSAAFFDCEREFDGFTYKMEFRKSFSSASRYLDWARADRIEKE